MTAAPRLLLITDRTQTGDRPLEDVVAACVSAGLTHVLVRERDLSEPAYDDVLARIHACVDERAVILERTARPESAGCHLSHGQTWPGRSNSALVGRSVHNSGDIHRARAEGADFAIVGPYARTTSKPGYGPPLGDKGLGALAAAAGDLPLLAVGGVRPSDLSRLAVVGASGVAVMGPLMRTADPGSLALEYVCAAEVFSSSAST